MKEVVFLIVGLVVGVVAAWLVARMLREAERRSLEEQRALLQEAETKLRDAFKALSAEVLGAQSEAFLRLAETKFATLRAEAAGDLGKRQEAIQALVKPLSDNLTRFDETIRSIEKGRQTAYGSLEELLRSLASQTANLTTALKGLPQVRGRWGELTLRRAAELAGMVQYCDFVEQPTEETEVGVLRPDMIVHLPAGRNVVVDAKVPLLAFLEALEAKTDPEREAALKRHAQNVRQHMKQLSLRRYWEQFDRTPDFVVCFFPGEGFFSVAVQYDRALIEDFVAQHVIPASPMTLIVLLRAVAAGWREEELAQSAKQISELGKELYARIGTLWGHLEELRQSLDNARDAWNELIGSLDRRVLPTLRRFRDLAARSADDLPVLEQVEGTTRHLPPPPESNTK